MTRFSAFGPVQCRNFTLYASLIGPLRHRGRSFRNFILHTSHFSLQIIISLFLFSGCGCRSALTRGIPPPDDSALLDSLIREITNELSTVPLEEFSPELMLDRFDDALPDALPDGHRWPPHAGTGLTAGSEKAKRLAWAPVPPGPRLLITTFVELNDLKKTSAFGRLISERLMTLLCDLGFPVIEIRRGHSIFIIEKEGEMVLTRNTGEIPDTIQAGAVIYGTYLASEHEVLVTARIARSNDFRILKSWNGRILKTPFIADLLRRDDQQPEADTEVYEHLPRD